MFACGLWPGAAFPYNLPTFTFLPPLALSSFPSHNPDEQDSVVKAILCRLICRMRPVKLPDLFRLRDHFRKVGCALPQASSRPGPGYRSSPGSQSLHALIALTAPDSRAWSYLAGHLFGAVHPTAGPSRGPVRPGSRASWSNSPRSRNRWHDVNARKIMSSVPATEIGYMVRNFV